MTASHADSTASERCEKAWAVLQQVPDPEVPAISLCELGIVRDVNVQDDDSLEVVLTPTYSGCPATEVIEQQVRDAILSAGLGPVGIRMQRAPAWTTDWITEDGRRKLKAYGIAPPGPVQQNGGAAVLHFLPGAAAPVDCPRCGSRHTERLSPFGSTACKALYRCLDCREPFEHFKPI